MLDFAAILSCFYCQALSNIREAVCEEHNRMFMFFTV